MVRKNQSPFEDMVDIASRFPWWACLLLAIASFIILNQISNIIIKIPTSGSFSSRIESFGAKHIFIGFARIGKFILPMAFTFGAILSAIKQRKRKNLFDSVSDSLLRKKHSQQPPIKVGGLKNGELNRRLKRNTPEGSDFKRQVKHPSVKLKPPIENKYNSDADRLTNMSWQEFEMLVSYFFKKQGYSVSECGGGGPDGGVDLRLKKNGKKILVQCKHWKTFKVGVRTVREQLGIMTAERAAQVIIVTSGLFTDEAIEFASNQHITLIDGIKLRKIITRTKKTISSDLKNNSMENIPDNSAPHCPKCSALMVERTAKKGKWAGSAFWGCSRFPRCRGIISK